MAEGRSFMGISFKQKRVRITYGEYQLRFRKETHSFFNKYLRNYHASDPLFFLASIKTFQSSSSREVHWDTGQQSQALPNITRYSSGTPAGGVSLEQWIHILTRWRTQKGKHSWGYYLTAFKRKKNELLTIFSVYKRKACLWRMVIFWGKKTVANNGGK